MRFCDQLNDYIRELDCMAKDICDKSSISASTFSRYRSGERIPAPDSDTLDKICKALHDIALERNYDKSLSDNNYNFDYDSLMQSFTQCEDYASGSNADKQYLQRNFRVLVDVLDISISRLSSYTNYDSSTLFRFRNGARQPSDAIGFASAVSAYVAGELTTVHNMTVLADLLECSTSDISDHNIRYQKIYDWLLTNQQHSSAFNSVSHFLDSLDEFDLNAYTKIFHFDKLTIPAMPFQLRTSRFCYGINEMMGCELDFLKATVTSRSDADVTMYSDMPMAEMAKDLDFAKKWMFGMAMLLKKGLHINIVHNLDRSLDELILGLESWIPLYMTGQVSPYYLKGCQNDVFLHFLRVSGAAVISGEAISGHHSDGRYYISKTKEDINYGRTRAKNLLDTALPLMNIYTCIDSAKMQAFLTSYITTDGTRRDIMSSPPLYTISDSLLNSILEHNNTDPATRQRILQYAALQRRSVETILENNIVNIDISYVNSEEFEQYPVMLSLSGMFHDNNIYYDYNEYCRHIKESREYAASHSNYSLNITSSHIFRNLQIHIHEGCWVLISKCNSPAIHFVIRHPKLRDAIEQFVKDF